MCTRDWRQANAVQLSSRMTTSVRDGVLAPDERERAMRGRLRNRKDAAVTL
jgi:hypothetical protein